MLSIVAAVLDKRFAKRIVNKLVFCGLRIIWNAHEHTSVEEVNDGEDPPVS
jgi:hypothetical protein